MTTTNEEARPQPAFPEADKAATPAASPAEEPAAPASTPPVAPPSQSTASRTVVVALVAALCGGIAGYAAKPAPIDETRFTNFDPESVAGSILGAGWSGFEQLPTGETFVWCAAESCTVHAQSGADGDRIIRARLSPFRFVGAPPQTVTVFVNETSIGTKPLPDGMSLISFPAPRALFRPGANDLRFQFAYAKTPKSVDPQSGDVRPLAAAFDWLEVATPPAPPQ